MSTVFTALKISRGDAFLLEDSEMKYLFDSGDRDTIVKLLRRRGINRIHLAICSHNDGDHANGFIEMFNAGIKIDEIWLPYWWASILQYADEHGIDWDKVKRISIDIKDGNIKEYNPESMFSDNHEPLSDEAFREVLSRLAERMSYTDMAPTYYSSFYSFAYGIAQKMMDDLSRNAKLKLDIDPNSDKAHKIVHNIARDVAHDIARDVAHHVAYHVDCHTYNRPDLLKYLFNHIDDYLPSNSFNHLMTANHENDVWIMFNNIMEIAVLAYRHGCTIKWFEPNKGCISFHKLDPKFNFIALNSTLKHQVKKLKDTYALAFALRLTVENEYSLAFEYLNENGIPILRFSADSDCTTQSAKYDGVIVTAPHHGSEANANIYSAIKGDNIIWVRSDCKSQSRPCKDFKSMKTRYCLACKRKTHDFKEEICFEYSGNKWRHVSGVKCLC